MQCTTCAVTYSLLPLTLLGCSVEFHATVDNDLKSNNIMAFKLSWANPEQCIYMLFGALVLCLHRFVIFFEVYLQYKHRQRLCYSG
jgi:hypothetical protein